jgi:hypothetical protein
MTLYWRSERDPEEDYNAFVHLVGDEGEMVAQVDAPPGEEAYPTSWWARGDVIADSRTLEIPAAAEEGMYRILVGLYRWPTMERLPVMNHAGEELPNGIVPLCEVQVGR